MSRSLAVLLSLLTVLPGPAAASQAAAAVSRGRPLVMPAGSMGIGNLGSIGSLGSSLSLGSVRLDIRQASPVPVLRESPRPIAAPVVPTAAPVLPAPGAPAAAAALREAGLVLSSPQTGQEAPGLEKGRWDAFWSRAVRPAAADTVLAAPEAEVSLAALAAPAAQPEGKAQVPPAPQKPQAGAKQAAVPVAFLGLAGVWALTRFGIASWAPGFFAKAAPYVAGGGILLGAYAVNRLAHKGVAVLARRLRWQPSTAVAAQVAASVVVYAAGGALALHAAGVSTAALLATFGIGGVAMTMAAKDFIGNFLEGVKILLNRPFVIGDRIRIGANEYVVKDMNLRYVELTRADGAATMMTYSQLAEKPVTIAREYAQSGASKSLEHRRSMWQFMGALARELPRPGLWSSGFWTLLGLGLAAALPFLPGLVAVRAVLPWLPYAQGAVTLLAARFLEKGAVGLLRRLAEARGWTPQGTVVLKLGVQLLVYLVGGTVALRFFGMTWSALLKSLGATSIAVGWASADIIGNLIQGFWILMTHPFSIGDTLEVGTVTGKVADITLNYVVLEHPDRSHTLVPYAVLRASPFTVVPDSPAQGRGQ